MEETAEDPLVAATRAEIMAYGMRRAAMTSIAKRAGLSRATLYRRAESTQQLVLDALVAQFRDILGSALDEPDPGATRHGRDRLVATAVRALALLWEDGLVRALLDHDPELLLPYIVDRLGRSQEAVIALLAGQIELAQADGSAREGDPRTLAVVLVQALTPFVVGRRLLASVDAGTDWGAEAGRLVEAYLRPGRDG